jgi:tRNA uridine 5-carboxymethylaminomethyl modification enzyme
LHYDVIVVGGGHAGIEAASAAARLGMETALITLAPDKIGLMSCNPAIGGLAKGHLVRELDALGGMMAKFIDHTGIHFKMLNRSKGPAVWSPRAQADKLWYAKHTQVHLRNTENLRIIADSGIGIVTKSGRIHGLQTRSHGVVTCHSLILTTGTFLNGVIWIGLQQMASGRAGEGAAYGLTESLRDHGLQSGRLKTGTPPRLDYKSIDFAATERQNPDNPPQPFSFANQHIANKQIDMYITYTDKQTHAILAEGFDRSPMFTGKIAAAGPRYCPSIEDKIHRFKDKERHQLFLEPEGYRSQEVYLNGFSTSLPADIQEKALRSIPGLRNAIILRLGYAVEYDYFYPHQINVGMECKTIENLFLAGQINGTSGYEEAAAQGFLAGVNAVHKLKQEAPLHISRAEGYIGVLADDLVTKSASEPYRMFTSSAEFRLLLRHDNADLRLLSKASEIGLRPEAELDQSRAKASAILSLQNQLENARIRAEDFAPVALARNSTPINQKVPARDLLRRPEITIPDIMPDAVEQHSVDVITAVEFEVKYEGYIKRMRNEVQRFRLQEKRCIPKDFNYAQLASLSTEAKEKLQKLRPDNLGQAAGIPGIKPSDVTALMIFLERADRHT